MEEFKWFLYSIIPLWITITIMVTTRNWNLWSFWNMKDDNIQETYRINDYQNHEPLISWWALYRSDGGYYIWEFSNVKTENPQKKRNGFWTMYYPDWCVLTWNWINWIIEWNWTYDCNEWIYSWEFKNNKINGLWVLKNKDNSYYSWEWLNEEPHWYGTLKYQDWAIYEWYWVKWIKEWTWKYTSTAGNIYEWMFSKWLKNWKWKVTYVDWTVQEWIWENDEFKDPINVAPQEQIMTWNNENEAD